MILFIDDIIPFVVSSSSLFVIHSNNEITHNSVSLLLHLGDQMLLFALIHLDLHSKYRNRIFVNFLSSVEFVNIGQIELLSLETAHLLPKTETFINELLIEGMGNSHNLFLSKLDFSCEKSPRLIAIILCSFFTSFSEPSYSLFDMNFSSKSLDLLEELIEVVSKLSSLHNLVSKFGSILNRNNVLRTSNPLLKPLSQHDSIDHISNSLKLINLSV